MNHIPIFDINALRAKVAGLTPRLDPDSPFAPERPNPHLRYLSSILSDPRGSDRKTLLGDDSMVQALSRIDAVAPSFSRPPGSFKRASVLSIRTGAPLRAPPLLLVGGPGLGKTWIARQIAGALGSAFVEHSLATADDPGVLLGHSESWKAARPGLVARTLLEGDTAAPVILIDELEKASDRDVDPFNGLHALLEVENSRRFVDGFLQLPLRADHIIWIFTANDISRLPASLLDRLLVIEIDAPTREQEFSLLRAVVSSFIAEFDAFLDPPIDDAVLEALRGASPRQIKRLLMLAFGFAAMDHRYSLDPDDIRRARGLQMEGVRLPIGFTPSFRT